jgi:hypothetical protein
MLEVAILRGVHSSACKQVAAATLWAKTLTKVKEGFVKLIPWDTIKTNLPAAFKLYPIVDVPHTNWLFRMILDLSFGVHSKHETIHLLVNKMAFDAFAPLLVMKELGNILSCLIVTIANLPDDHSPCSLPSLTSRTVFGTW